MARILIAEDDPLVSAFLEKGLRSRGHVTVAVGDGLSATALALSSEFDLVLLDMGLPARDGFHALVEMRARGLRTPVLVLTGRPDLRDAVECLEYGADDYMTKPFRLEELLARVTVRLRGHGAAEPGAITAGRLSLDLRTRRVHLDGRAIDLTNREFVLLETFMRHEDQVLSREQLLAHVWGFDAEPGTNVVNVYVSALRRKLGDEVIESVRGVGYRFRPVDGGGPGTGAGRTAR